MKILCILYNITELDRNKGSNGIVFSFHHRLNNTEFQKNITLSDDFPMDVGWLLVEASKHITQYTFTLSFSRPNFYAALQSIRTHRKY
ncbi:hypothetical protein PR048_019974, partial [Dryococelus australis]